MASESKRPRLAIGGCCSAGWGDASEAVDGSPSSLLSVATDGGGASSSASLSFTAEVGLS